MTNGGSVNRNDILAKSLSPFGEVVNSWRAAGQGRESKKYSFGRPRGGIIQYLRGLDSVAKK